jgi:hypothetical protein
MEMLAWIKKKLHKKNLDVRIMCTAFIIGYHNDTIFLTANHNPIYANDVGIVCVALSTLSRFFSPNCSLY